MVEMFLANVLLDWTGSYIENLKLQNLYRQITKSFRDWASCHNARPDKVAKRKWRSEHQPDRVLEEGRKPQMDQVCHHIMLS